MRALRWEAASGSLAVTVFPDPDALGRFLAEEILAGIRDARRAGRRFVLGCPGGRSLRSTYRALAAGAAASGEDLSVLVVAMMDDYILESTAGYTLCRADAHYSCRRFAREEIAGVVNSGLSEGRSLRPENVWLPDPADPSDYDARLRQAGGIDLFLLASGASDGHVAFNPPGSRIDQGTRIVRLAQSTRRDNLATFPQFRGIAEVPRLGVSVGLGTIAELSRQAVLVIHGAHKRPAVRRLASCRDFTPDWPASVIYRCRGGRVLLDEAAAGSLEESTS